MSGEQCYREKQRNNTRSVTRFIIKDRVIHTDWNCLMERYEQKSTLGHGKCSIETWTAIFRIKK